MKITITNNDTVITVSNPGLQVKHLQDILGIAINSKVSPVTQAAIKVTPKKVELQYDVDAMSKQAGLDLRSCSSVHKLVTLAPSFVISLKPTGFRRLVDWLCRENWLSYRPEDKSLHTYYNKAQRSLR